MKYVLALSALALAAAGQAVAAPRALSGFDTIDARAGVRVEVTVGPAFSVDVSGSDAERILTRVDGDRLIVEPVRNTRWRDRRDALVRVTMPVVEHLDTSSGANVTVSGVNGGAVRLDVSSGANLNVTGACASFTADVSSGAVLRSEQLRCENGAVDISSGANAHVFASERINVDASSGGRVIVHGGGATGEISLSSGGSMRRAT